jgi:transposase
VLVASKGGRWSDPEARAGCGAVVFETGPRAPWFHRELTADGRPAVGIDAKHAKAALDTAPNKTDANDADGLALLAEAGFFREVRVKSWEAMRAEQSR